jgi:hypothetical protein
MFADAGQRGAKFTGGHHRDGGGLQLVVSASGRRKSILRYQRGRVRRDKGLGSYPAVLGGKRENSLPPSLTAAVFNRGIVPDAAETSMA